jgi:hypothetical protein
VIALNANTFHEVMAAQVMAACILHRGPFAACAQAVQALTGATGGSWAWARIDLDQAPAIAEMFGIGGSEPHLLIMRDAVVLYCAPLTATGMGTPRTVLDRAAALDMLKIRAEIEQERAGRASLFARRVCPTALRTREDDGSGTV